MKDIGQLILGRHLAPANYQGRPCSARNSARNYLNGKRAVGSRRPRAIGMVIFSTLVIGALLVRTVMGIAQDELRALSA